MGLQLSILFNIAQDIYNDVSIKKYSALMQSEIMPAIIRHR
jgi:hypothetical protein